MSLLWAATLSVARLILRQERDAYGCSAFLSYFAFVVKHESAVCMFFRIITGWGD